MAIEVAEGTTLEEPALFSLPFVHRTGPPPHEPLDHGLPVRQIDQVAVGLPAGTVLSAASVQAGSEGLLRYFPAEGYLLELTCFAAHQAVCDLRPVLPLLFRATHDGR
jgi:hypothetical protein